MRSRDGSAGRVQHVLGSSTATRAASSTAGVSGAGGAHGDQQILEAVGERADRRAADDVGGALERVDGAEQRVQLGIAGALPLERDQRRTHGLQVLGRLGAEVREHLVAVGEEAEQVATHRVGVEGRAWAAGAAPSLGGATVSSGR